MVHYRTKVRPQGTGKLLRLPREFAEKTIRSVRKYLHSKPIAQMIDSKCLPRNHDLIIWQFSKTHLDWAWDHPPLSCSSVEFFLSGNNNLILEFQRGFGIVFQWLKIHYQGILHGEYGVIFQIWVFPIEDLSRERFVSLTLHLMPLAGEQPRHR